MARSLFCIFIILVCLSQQGQAAECSASSLTTASGALEGATVKDSEKEELLSQIRISNAGSSILDTFLKRFKSFNNLVLIWDEVSFSELASVTSKTPSVCVHLTKKLPKIEHIADLVHELTHASFMTQDVLDGKFKSAEKFIEMRLSAEGGEAHAFSVECQVKKDLQNSWDHLCEPYVNEREDKMDMARIVDDLYNGTLSASLTGDSYPVLLKRQFLAMQERVKRQNQYRKISSKMLENK